MQLEQTFQLEAHQSTIDKLNSDNLKYSALLSALIGLVDNYHTAYVANLIEIETVCSNIVFNGMVGLEDDPKHKTVIQQVKRLRDNKINKAKNFDAKLHTFMKNASKQYAHSINDDETLNLLIDTMIEFWDQRVEALPDRLLIKTIKHE